MKKLFFLSLLCQLAYLSYGQAPVIVSQAYLFKKSVTFMDSLTLPNLGYGSVVGIVGYNQYGKLIKDTSAFNPSSLFGNGLTYYSGYGGLGGSLNQNSVIDGLTHTLQFKGENAAANYSMIFNPNLSSPSITITATKSTSTSSLFASHLSTYMSTTNSVSNTYIGTTGSSFTLSVTNSTGSFQINSSGQIVDNINHLGLYGSTSFEANYNDSSYVDKHWVNGLLAGKQATLTPGAGISIVGSTISTTIASSFGNGITWYGSYAGLGGVLNQGTSIDPQGNGFSIQSTGGGQLVFGSATSGAATSSVSRFTPTAISTYLINSSSQATGLFLNSTYISFQDDINNKGVTYLADYSALGHLDPLWIPNLGYISSTFISTSTAASLYQPLLAYTSNPSSSALSKSTLNTNYPTATHGYIIYLPNASLKYLKMDDSSTGNWDQQPYNPSL